MRRRERIRGRAEGEDDREDMTWRWEVKKRTWI
jgi:hypothetical protein